MISVMSHELEVQQPVIALVTQRFLGTNLQQNTVSKTLEGVEAVVASRRLMTKLMTNIRLFNVEAALLVSSRAVRAWR